MRPPIDLRFRPGLILFVDEAGQQICEQLRAITSFAGLDPVLCQSIALLHVSSASLATTPLPRCGLCLEGTIPQQTDTLEHVLPETIRNVQSSRRIQEIINAGYPVPNPRTQVYLVGDTSQPWLQRVFSVVQAQLQRLDTHTLVCYMLHAPHVTNEATGDDAATQAAKPVLATGEQAMSGPTHNVANFCYLYEDMLAYPTPTFVSTHESYYALAEALFTLLSTGITTEPFFEESMRVSASFTPADSVGSLSTSMVVFPEAAIVDYCSVRLGADMLKQWQQELQGSTLAEPRHVEIQARARSMVKDINRWLDDGPERPLANGPRSYRKAKGAPITERRMPSLEILTREQRPTRATSAQLEQAQQQMEHKAQRFLHQRLLERTQAQFALFWPDQLKKEYKRRGRYFASWTELLDQQVERASTAHAEWNDVVTQAWQAATERVCDDVSSTADQLWASDEAGPEMSALYVQELQTQLEHLTSHLATRQSEHERDYQAALELLHTAEQGLWHAQEEADNAEPVAQQLQRRLVWQQQQIPAIPAQVCIAIPCIIALVTGLLALPWLPQSSAAVAITSAIVVLLLAVGHWLWHRRRARRYTAAQDDLLAFYRRGYAYRCEQREDQLRSALLEQLRANVQHIAERQNKLVGIVQETSWHMEEQAPRIQHDLFHSPAAARDVFVAQGNLLQKDQRNTLDDLYTQITQARTRTPVESWHQSARALKKQFMLSFYERQQSFLEIEQEQLQQQLYSFAQGVTRPYCTGPLSGLHAALSKLEIWNEVFERARHPLYRAQVGTQEPQYTFVCGHETEIQQGLSRMSGDSYPVRISDAHKWVLVAAFFRGGEPAVLYKTPGVF